MRVVFDTNVLVSYLINTQSVPGRAVTAVLRNGRMLLSDATYDEFCRTIYRPKFDALVTQRERRELIDALGRIAERVDVAETIAYCRDPADDKFLDVAVSGKADCIVTGDDDLLVLATIRGIDILTPRAFLTRFGLN